MGSAARPRRTFESHPVEYDHTLLDPLLEADDALSPQLAFLIQTSVARAHAGLELVHARRHLAPAFRLNQVCPSVQLGAARRPCERCVVQDEPLDSEQTMVNKPLGQELELASRDSTESDVEFRRGLVLELLRRRDDGAGRLSLEGVVVGSGRWGWWGCRGGRETHGGKVVV